MKYPDEVLETEGYAVLKELPVPQEKELQLALEIVKGLSGDLDFNSYKDEYRERIEVLVRSKMEGVVIVPDTKKAKPPAKSLMEALRMTAESLK
jgi:DNA end-binding protein Ku